MCLRALSLTSALMAVTWWVALLPSLSGTFLFSLNLPARPLMWQALKLKFAACMTSSLRAHAGSCDNVVLIVCVSIALCRAVCNNTRQKKKNSPAALTTTANKPLQSPFSPSLEQQTDRNKSGLFMFDLQGQNRRKKWEKEGGKKVSVIR